MNGNIKRSLWNFTLLVLLLLSGCISKTNFSSFDYDNDGNPDVMIYKSGEHLVKANYKTKNTEISINMQSTTQNGNIELKMKVLSTSNTISLENKSDIEKIKESIEKDKDIFFQNNTLIVKKNNTLMIVHNFDNNETYLNIDNDTNLDMKIVKKDFGYVKFIDKNNDEKADKVILAGNKIIFDVEKRTIEGDLNENGIADIEILIEKNGKIKVINYSVSELVKCVGKNLKVLRKMKEIKSLLQSQQYDEIMELIKEQYPDIYAIYEEIKENPKELEKIITKDVFFENITYNTSDRITIPNLEKTTLNNINETHSNEITNINDTEINTNVTSINTSTEINISSPEEAIKLYYHMIENKKDVVSLFSDAVNLTLIKEIHDMLYEAFNKIEYQINNLKCQEFEYDSEKVWVCKYHLKSKFIDKNGKTFINEKDYMSILDSNYKMVITQELE